MRVLFINAMQPDAFTSDDSIHSIHHGNKIVSSKLPEASFFPTYTKAYSYYKHRPYSFTHIVTSCTPARGLEYSDKGYINPDINKYLHEHHHDDLEWLDQYKYALSHLAEFKKLNNSVKFIVYSGAGYQSKPTGAFGDSLTKVLGDYDYVPKTNKPEEDAVIIQQLLRNIDFQINVTYANGEFQVDKFYKQGIILPESDLDTAIRVFVRSISSPYDDALKELEYILNHKHTERDVDMFLREKFHMLNEPGYRKKVIVQPFLEGSQFHNKRPDFILQPILETLPAKIIELKRPDFSVYKNQSNNLDLSFTARVASAVDQVRHYQQYFEDSANRTRFKLKHNFNVFKPHARILIGQNYVDQSAEDILFLKDQHAKDKIEIMTYHEFLAILKHNRGFYH